MKNKYEHSRTEVDEMDTQLQDLRKQQSQLQSEKNELSLTINTLNLKIEGLVENIQENHTQDLKKVAFEHQNGKRELPEPYTKWNEIPWEEAKENLEGLQHKLKKMGDVHLGSIQEYDEVNSTLFVFITSER